MKFFDRIKNGIRHGPRYFFKDYAEPGWTKLADLLGLDADMDREAMSEATYFTCLKVLSEAIGKLPLKLFQRDQDGNLIECRDTARYQMVNSRPNPYMTATTFWSTVEQMRNHYGNAFVLIDGFGDRMNLWIMNPTKVSMIYDNAHILSEENPVFYQYNTAEGPIILKHDEVLHFKSSASDDGLTGKPVRKILMDTVLSAKKAQKLMNKLYSTGFTAKAVLQYTGDLSKEAEIQLLEHIERFAKGELSEKGTDSIIPIPLGMNLQPLNMKLSDSQYIEVKQYTAIQIASAFGIKPQQIGDYSKSSYASAEAQSLAFYVDTLLYIVKQYEEELSYKLLTEEERAKGMYFKFNIDVILRADFTSKVQALSTAVNSFLMTPNEARKKLDYGNVEGGDRLLGNGASIPVELTGTQYQKGGESDGESNQGPDA